MRRGWHWRAVFGLLLVGPGCAHQAAQHAGTPATNTLWVGTGEPLGATGRVDFGTLAPDRRARAEVLLINRGSEPLRIARASTSCECVTLRPVPVDVPAEGQTTVWLECDLRNDPNFAGILAVELSLNDTNGRCLGRLKARILVPARRPAQPDESQAVEHEIGAVDRG